MKVLLVEPRESSRDAIRRAFAARGCSVRGFASFEEAEPGLADFAPDVVVAAADAADGDAVRFLRRARSSDPQRSVFALVDVDDLDRGVAAAAAGADDFLWRPLSEARVVQLLASAKARREREERSETIRLELARAQLRDALPGRSPRWLGALASLERAAAGGASVLMTGESGTEKDDAALALHRLSPRGAGRFAYISEGESLDLATRQTGPGTLFLQNVEAASLGFQELLLAHLESGRPTRFVVGIDEDPADALAAGRLLRGLHVALFESVVHLPPLRERDGDVAILAESLLEAMEPGLAFEADALDVLRAHDWPGNVIELREVVRRAARLSERTIGPIVMRSVLARPLPRAKQRRRKAPVVRIAVGDSLADVERRLISKTLEFARGNKKKTAELLKLSLKTIYNKIKEYGLEH
ncbi:MAG TPA: helix-turn-helix domain-containing protein [Thermoanaerobaculia bacterium]|nr:helix-turn-helix domain-containing protein [Thermoanaerobaculia bacterium]